MFKCKRMLGQEDVTLSLHCFYFVYFLLCFNEFDFVSDIAIILPSEIA